ncbi:cytochrome b/b6 domain-containing protein [Denitratisoma oestradiolicum]|uniref:Cytochrome B n=1 Tax=Denitratisoma oestradiolicum TaxID=311182 RepID=A0A6S6XYI7_9PROT|nr:cytochrome b/b6 domain-containing protein [Denitratisoma oestradiolicum]TWO80169.1 hypothetical protein CBW56_11435 [Denitratisoma oestradiolicum]CAB1369983.1 Cytochrome B [Denitratisoma oestradiolicum]
MKQGILVWDLPVRIFHWSLVGCFALAWLTSESERYQGIHLLAGYLLLALIGLRLVWGLVGSRYARFPQFVRGPSAVLGYLRSLLGNKPEHHVGHNPAGALAIVLLLLLGLGTGISGWLHFNEIGVDVLEEVHEALASAMLALVAIHVLGVALSGWLHKENLVKAMFTGRKSGEAAAGISRAHGIIALLLVLVLGVLGWNLVQGTWPALMNPGAVGTGQDHHHGDDD